MTPRQAVIDLDVGETLITRYELSALLDKLEQMEDRRRAPKPAAADDPLLTDC